jgi:hypothetical protein
MLPFFGCSRAATQGDRRHGAPEVALCNATRRFLSIFAIILVAWLPYRTFFYKAACFFAIACFCRNLVKAHYTKAWQ